MENKIAVKGTKKKIDIAPRDTKEQRCVAFSKRRPSLFKKVAELSNTCESCQATVAVLTTAPCGKPEYMHSLDPINSSAFDIAKAYLEGTVPPPKSSEFWWEDSKFDEIEDDSEKQELKERLQKTINDVVACLQKRGNFVNTIKM